MKKELGRPTNLTDEVIAKAKEYLIRGFEDVGNTVPSVAGLGCYLGASRSSLYEWAGKDEDFSDTLDAIKMKQEMMLIDGGLGSSMNSTIVKLMLANHGYSDKQKMDISANVQPAFKIIFEDDEPNELPN